MTASANDNAPTLPSVFDVLLYSITLTKRYAADVYGFTAYLLFPLILYFGIQGVPGSLGKATIAVVYAVFIGVACWVAAAVSTLVSLKSAHPKNDHDPRSIGTHATNVLTPLVLATFLYWILQAAGYFLFIIPGILATIIFTFAFEEVVLRGRGPITALAESRTHVKHQILAVGQRLFGVGLAYFLVYAALSMGAIALGAALLHTSVGGLLIDRLPLWLDAAISLIQIALVPPIVIAHTVLYLSTAPTVD